MSNQFKTGLVAPYSFFFNFHVRKIINSVKMKILLLTSREEALVKGLINENTPSILRL